MLAVGHQLGPYRILSALGAGGMGEVYLAEDTRLRRNVALKVLPPATAVDERSRKRLIREAQAAATLDHPNICTVYDVGEADGQSYIAMQYVEGQTLAARLKRGPLDLSSAVAIAAQMAAALAEAHRHDIVHRDVKPQNIMLTPGQQVKVLDFGLAKVTTPVEHDARTATFLTEAGAIAGTVPYMSPEQVRGEPVDPRSDVFSLGCVLYEMIGRVNPFLCPNAADTMSAVLTREPPSLPQATLPSELPRIVRKCLEKDQDRRYQTMRDLLVDLESVAREIASRPTLSPEAGLPRRHGWGWRAARLAVLPVAGVLLVAGGTYLYLLLRANAPARQSSADLAQITGLPDSAPDGRTASPKQLTTRGGYNGMPAISVDGSRIAYVSDRTGHFEIYLTTPHVGATDAALTSDGQDNVEPAWSPDGQWLAYHAARRGGIWMVPATGGTPQQIVEFGGSPSWSPDGEHLVFVSGSETSSLHSLLWTARRDGSDRRQVTASGRPAGGHRLPSWSHDGRYVVFASTDNSGVEIWLLRLSDGRLSRLIGGSTGVSNFPHFSPGTTAVFAPGDRAVYATGFAEGGNARVWRLRIDAERGEPVGPLEAVVPLNNEIIDRLSIAQNGTLVYSVDVQDANIWAIDVPVTGSPGEPVRLTDDSVRDTLPRFAPDGRLAYQQFTIGGGLTLVWLMRKDGSGRQPLIAEAGYAFPQWSPDGKRVLVAKATGQRNDRELCWVDVDTRRVVGTGVHHIGSAIPHLSPDGARFAFFRIEPDGSANVWTQALDGGPPRQITSGVSASYPAWSPDGRWLAIELEHDADAQVGIVPAEGGAVEQLTTDPGLHFVYSWAPDGDRLTYAGERDDVWNIYTVSRRTRKITTLTHFTSPNGYVRYPAWSPLGDRVAFERAFDKVTLWTVQMR
jgi:eukaryotic-like serine/threonine-protein kinase